MTETNIIEKIQRFVDNKEDREDYRFEKPSGINPSVIIFGEKHSDFIEINDIVDLITKLGFVKFVLLAEHKLYFENNWKEKYGCSEVILCDLEAEDQDKKQKELLRSNLSTEELKEFEDFGFGTDSYFEGYVQKFPYLMKLFYCDKEKAMGEIICRCKSRETSKPIIVIIGHYHAREDSEVHRILEKEKIVHICIWNEKIVEEKKKKYQYFQRNSAQESDMCM